MGDAVKNGLEARGADVAGAAGEVPDGPDGPGAGVEAQDELFPMAVSPARHGDGQALATRGPGRPPGAKNKRTEDWAAFILSRYASPLIFMAETYSRDVHELALEIGCCEADALALQSRCARDLAPYIHSKMPVAVETTSKSAGVLAILMPGDPRSEVIANELGIDLPFRAAPVKTAETSQKTNAAARQSDADQSDATVKPLADIEE